MKTEKEIESKKKICIVHVGGTIVSKNETGAGKVPAYKISEVIEKCLSYKQKKAIDAEVSYKVKAPFGKDGKGIDSSELKFKHVKEIADIIKKNYNKYDGFVITHGTDTMAYTSSLLSFMLLNADKPIIITGSQKAPDDKGTDVPKNLYDTFKAATSENSGVYIVFDGDVIKGSRAKKISSTKLKAFGSVNEKAITIDDFVNDPYKELLKKPKFSTELSEKVGVFYLTPSTSVEDLAFFAKGKDGIIIQAYGLGGAPSDINDYIKEELVGTLGKYVVFKTQCEDGLTDLTEYEVGVKASKGGVIAAADMSLEATYAKLSHILGNYTDKETIKKMMYTNLSGEMNPQGIASYLEKVESQSKKV